MSQSAENQSAIIENENNYNIAMESQAAEAEPDTGPETPTQDEIGEPVGMETEDITGGDPGGTDFAEELLGVAGEEDPKAEEMQNHAEREAEFNPLEHHSDTQDIAESTSMSTDLAAESQDQNRDQEFDAGMMDFQEQEPEGVGEAGNEGENEYFNNESDYPDYAQESETNPQAAAEQDYVNEETGPVEASEDPATYGEEADNLALEPDASVDFEGDQGIATDNLDAEESEAYQQAEMEGQDQGMAAEEVEQQWQAGNDLQEEMDQGPQDDQNLDQNLKCEQDQQMVAQEMDQNMIDESNQEIRDGYGEESAVNEEESNAGDNSEMRNDEENQFENNNSEIQNDQEENQFENSISEVRNNEEENQLQASEPVEELLGDAEDRAFSEPVENVPGDNERGIEEGETATIDGNNENQEYTNIDHSGETGEDNKTDETINDGNSEIKADDADKKDDPDQALETEGDETSATIEEKRGEDEAMPQSTDIKSDADTEGNAESAGDDASKASNETIDMKTTNDSGESDPTDKQGSEDKPEKVNAEQPADKKPSAPPQDDDDDDVVVLGEDAQKKESGEKVLNSNNEMGIQIESVSGGANDVHECAPVKKEKSEAKPAAAAPKKGSQNSTSSKKSSKIQTCIVCKKVGKCKYNIVRNGDIKHLCDDACFKRFRANPTIFLKGSGSSTNASAEKKSTPAGAPAAQGAEKAASSSSYKTCTVCLVMNVNAQQGQFCLWKGLDFCGEGCLGKFQSGMSSSCALCMVFIPVTSRSTHCLRIGNQMKPFCSKRCYGDFKQRLRLCTHCQKDASLALESFFSAPVGSDGSFKDFCSQTCMKKFEELLNTDVEIIRADAGKPRNVSKCSVCQKKQIVKHTIKHNKTLHNFCSDPCLTTYQYSKKLNLKSCDFCNSVCTSRETSLHTVQVEGHQNRFCSENCVNKFRFNNRKVSPCSWCGTQRDNSEMIERLDSASKYQLFCSLNCLSLYRVNLQAKSNQTVTCDHCSKQAPAQYHLTMSDASVRNFCSYNCVMTFQAQFQKGAPPPAAAGAGTQAPPAASKHKHNTRGKAGRGKAPATPASPSFPIISNVISLAPQGGQKVNIKNSTGMPVVVSGANQATKTKTVASQGPVQQQIIVQPPPPKPVKNKSVLCKPFVQTKATSCRPHTQNKDCQTDEVKAKPVIIPVPVPVHIPTPLALYSNPAPTPIFIPIPIPVPIFIPTTRKSAHGILKQIKEIREKTPADPLEAELLAMAAAVSNEGKSSSDSESEDDMMPDINRSKKRSAPADDDDDADVMPLTSGKEEEGGEEDMISMALRMAEEMSGPIADLESAVEAVPVNRDPPPQPPRTLTPDAMPHDDELMRRRGGMMKRGAPIRRGGIGRPPKRPRMQVPQPEPIPLRQEPPAPPPPPADANYHLKFTYGVNAWRHWVLFKNNQLERNVKPGCGRIKLFKTDIMQCTADELNYSLCLFVKEVRKPNGDEYSPDSIYYLTLGIQQYLYENGRIDNIFTDFYYERFTESLTQILAKCQPKFNASGQMVCRIEEEHLWECKQLGAHSPYVLLNTLIYFHTKYFMLKTPEDHMKLSFAHILKYWKKGTQPGKGGQPARSVSLRYYSVSTAKKDGSAPTSATKKGSKDGIPVYEVTENQENPLRCPVKLYEFYLSKCPESIKNRSDIFYPVPERSCVPDSPVWYSTMPIGLEVMAKMLTRILLVREIQEAHLHAQPIFV